MRWIKERTNPNYEISDTGLVKSLYTNKHMTPQVDKDGYLYVRLYNKSTKTYSHKRIYRLVLDNFVRPAEELEECHHKDNNRQNNNLDNLEWVTRQENDSHVIHKVNDGSYEPVPVRQLTPQGKIVAEYESMAEASRQTGCSVSKISCVCRGERKTTGGFRWEKI